jgi:hypothetical protein
MRTSLARRHLARLLLIEDLVRAHHVRDAVG